MRLYLQTSVLAFAVLTLTPRIGKLNALIRTSLVVGHSSWHLAFQRHSTTTQYLRALRTRPSQTVRNMIGANTWGMDKEPLLITYEAIGRYVFSYVTTVVSTNVAIRS